MPSSRHSHPTCLRFCESSYCGKNRRYVHHEVLEFGEGELTTEFKRVVVGLSIIFVLSFLVSLGCTIATIVILLRKDTPLLLSSQNDHVNLYPFSQPTSSTIRLLVYVMSRRPPHRLLHFGLLRWVLNLQCWPLQYITPFPARGALEILWRGSCTAAACCSFSASR